LSSNNYKPSFLSLNMGLKPTLGAAILAAGLTIGSFFLDRSPPTLTPVFQPTPVLQATPAERKHIREMAESYVTDVREQNWVYVPRTQMLHNVSKEAGDIGVVIDREREEALIRTGDEVHFYHTHPSMSPANYRLAAHQEEQATHRRALNAICAKYGIDMGEEGLSRFYEAIAPIYQLGRTDSAAKQDGDTAVRLISNLISTQSLIANDRDDVAAQQKEFGDCALGFRPSESDFSTDFSTKLQLRQGQRGVSRIVVAPRVRGGTVYVVEYAEGIFARPDVFVEDFGKRFGRAKGIGRPLALSTIQAFFDEAPQQYNVRAKIYRLQE
jgi:hypothetical protein